MTDGNGDPVTTTTDGSGNYSFNNLTPGDYTVVETQPDGLFNVSEDEGGIDDDQNYSFNNLTPADDGRRSTPLLPQSILVKTMRVTTLSKSNQVHSAVMLARTLLAMG